MILKSLHKSVWLNELFLQSLPTFFVFRLVNHGSSFSCACNVWFISSLHLGCLTCLYSCPSRVTELGVKPWEQCVSIWVFCYIQPEQIKHINEYSLLHLNNKIYMYNSSYVFVVSGPFTLNISFLLSFGNHSGVFLLHFFPQISFCYTASQITKPMLEC